MEKMDRINLISILSMEKISNDFGFYKPQNSDWSSNNYIGFEKRSTRTPEQRDLDMEEVYNG